MDSAPSSDTTPPTTQASVMRSDPGAFFATSVAGTMKIADAIIVPALIMMASSRLSSRLRSVATVGDGIVMVWELGVWSQDLGLQPQTPDSQLLQSSVAVNIQPPTCRRLRGTREVDAYQTIDEAHTGTDAGERPDEREVLARAGVPYVGEDHGSCRGPAVRKLETAAPECVAARSVAVVPAHRAGAAEIPERLDRDLAVGHAARELERSRHLASEWGRDAECGAGPPELVRP